MADKITITGPDGRRHEAVRVAVREPREQWSEYILEDGSMLRMRAVLTDVVRILDMYDAQGNPVYVANSQPVVAVIPAEGLRRKLE